MNKKREGKPKSKHVHFMVNDETYRALLRLAKAKHRDTVPSLLYAQALELAESAEARA